jgi:DNA-binding NarL/FixJ family response regulator
MRKSQVKSEEQKRKISESHQGKKLSPEHREKVIKSLHMQHGEKHPSAKMTEKQAKLIVDMLIQGYRIIDISKYLSINYDVIKAIKLKKSWRHLTQGMEFSSQRTKKVCLM